MNTLILPKLRHNWQLLFAILAALLALSSALSPAHVQAASASIPTPAVSGVSAPAHALVAEVDQQGPVPGDPAASKGRLRYFSQTGHFLKGAFLAYWESRGATPVFGLPVTEPIVEGGLTVQYLERARYEWHPEQSDPKQRVLLTRLGAITTQERGLIFDRLGTGADTPQSHFFGETGHNLSNAFFTFWLRNGGLAVFGYPISEEVVETSPTDGQQYSVQYFERNRFEWHPENPPISNVQLGLLGSEYAHEVGLDPLARVMLPASITGGADLTDSSSLNNLVDAGLLPAVKALGRTPEFQWVPALIVQNKIVVEFADIGEEGVAGAFVATTSKTRPYVIIIPTTQRNASVESLASVLAHEATHADDVISGVIAARSNCSVEEELRAYLNGLAAWLVLKGNDALAQHYPASSLDAAINRSLRDFNNGDTRLTLDFNLQAGRSFLADLYGSSCGR